MDQFSQANMFICECDFRCDLEVEDQVIRHMSECQLHQYLYRDTWNRINFGDGGSLRELLVWRCNYKALINKINENLFCLGYEKAFDESKPQQAPILKPQSSSGIASNNCPSCKKQFDLNHQFDQLWYFEQCCHMVCKQCLQKIILSEYLLRDGQLKCPEDCDKLISRDEVKSIIGVDKLNELDEKLLLKSQNIVQCAKCKDKFAFESGDLNSVVKDAKGNKLDGRGLDHYIKNRFTCSNAACKTEQCRTCSAVPYHLGYDCDEYRKVQVSRKCRFCEQTIDAIDITKPQSIQEVCNNKDCLARASQVCLKINPCGHPCCGYRGEVQCIPCIEESCIKPQDNIQQNGDDYCNVCFTEALKCSPCVRARCGHIFHQECITKRLEGKWNGPRIVFNFCQCPLCKVWLEFPIDHQVLPKLMNGFKQLNDEIKIKVIERVKAEGREKDKELTDPKHPFFQKPLDYGMAIYCYYECHKCQKPYFGGLKSCQVNIEDQVRQYDKSELVCPKCCPISFETECKKHGNDYIEFKCKFCCSVALWFCWGTTHFCEPCHRKATEMSKKAVKDLAQCANPESCPLRIKHKPNGEECALGCGLCRQERILEASKKAQEQK